MPAPLRFFFYGTLIAGSGNATARAVHDRLRPIGPGSVSGALWAIPDDAGWYPALVPGDAGQAHGMLYAATDRFGPDDLARLDAWEDYRPHQLTASRYLREEMQVGDPAGAHVAAQAYRYNQPLPRDARRIVRGDFQAWLDATGFRPYGG